MPARQQTPSAALGTLLLRGHTMLAESCPSCNIPLMRDPATMQSLCVGCQRSFSQAEVQAINAPQQHEELAAPPEPSAVGGPLHAAAPSSTHQAAAVAATSMGQQPAARPMNGPLTSALARHHRRTTSNGGSSDGAGSPNLMPAQAPITPAGAAAAATGTLSPASTTASAAAGAGASATAAGAATAAAGSQLTSGGAHAQEATDDEVLQAYQQIRAERQREDQQQQRQQPPPQANGTAAGMPAPRQQQPDVSQLMADKMLAGWALLGDHCPICSTPLMRERSTRQVYCVACNLPVRLEQQVSASGASTDRSTRGTEQQPQSNGPVAAAPAPDAASPTAAAAVTASVAAAGLRALVHPAESAAAAVAARHGAGDALSKQQVMADLHQALLTKLHEARQHLLAIPSSQHEQMMQQLQLIQQLLQTLAVAE